jgi:hypothetical protein
MDGAIDRRELLQGVIAAAFADVDEEKGASYYTDLYAEKNAALARDARALGGTGARAHHQGVGGLHQGQVEPIHLKLQDSDRDGTGLSWPHLHR